MSNVYGINVNISLTGGILGALGSVIGRFHTLNGGVNAVTASLTRMQMAGIGAMGIGAVAATAGVGMVKGALAISRAADELNFAKTKLATAGIGADIAAQYVQAARNIRGQALGTTIAERINLAQDLHAVFGDPKDVLKALPVYSQYFAAYRFQNPDDKEGRGFNNAQKAIDLGGRAIGADGGLDVRKFESELRMMNAISTYTNGRVNLDQQFQFARRAGIANKGLTQEGYRGLSPLMDTMGASQAGVAFQTAYSSLLGGRMQKAGAMQWVEAGLLDPSKMRKAGNSFILGPGALSNGDQFRADPAAWIRDTMMPAAFRRAGLGEGASSDEQRKAVLDMLEPMKMDRNAKNFLSEMAFSHIDGTWARDLQNTKNAEGVNPYAKFISSDPKANRSVLAKAWSDTMSALGESAGPALIPFFQNLTAVLNKVSTWAEANPDAVGNIVKGMMIVGVFLAVFGVALMAVGVVIAAITFPIVGTVVAIAAGIAALVAVVAFLFTVDWNKVGTWIKEKFQQVMAVVGKFFTDMGAWVVEKIIWLMDMHKRIRTALWDGIKRLFSGLGDYIKSLMPKMGGTGQVVDGVAQGPRGEPGEGAARGGAALAGALTRQSYVPPAPRGGSATPVNFVVNLDGREIARNTSTHLADNLRHNTGPSTFDAGVSWAGGLSNA